MGDSLGSIVEIQHYRDIARKYGDRLFVVAAQMFMAETHFRNGEIDLAIGLASEALGLFESLALQSFEIMRIDVLVNRSLYYLIAGDLESGYRDAAEARIACRDFAPMSVGFENEATIYSMQHLATVAALRGHPVRGARLLGHADAMLKRGGRTRGKAERLGHELLITTLRKHLQQEEIATQAAGGSELSEQAAIELALADVETE
jgi:hypothetical protein